VEPPKRRAAVDAWRAANDLWAKLERSEAGRAERPEIMPIDPALRRFRDWVVDEGARAGGISAG